ncbi:hypothetical protein [Staphylococcus pasteuri]|uniref:hypothetical protein n=1 Tax=Staphylococcus pasteuri TaxID=45972 RepID=UPI0012BA2333|nr:hypothetical protein [Staphylococcus pasteuri]
MPSSNIKNSSNTININAQYISESDSLRTENELLREQIRYYKKYINQYLPDFIDEKKAKRTITTELPVLYPYAYC